MITKALSVLCNNNNNESATGSFISLKSSVNNFCKLHWPRGDWAFDSPTFPKRSDSATPFSHSVNQSHPHTPRLKSRKSRKQTPLSMKDLRIPLGAFRIIPARSSSHRGRLIRRQFRFISNELAKSCSNWMKVTRPRHSWLWNRKRSRKGNK